MSGSQQNVFLITSIADSHRVRVAFGCSPPLRGSLLCWPLFFCAEERDPELLTDNIVNIARNGNLS